MKNFNIWFTSDTHFAHKNIIKYCNRPFKDEIDMDDYLFKRWFNKVKEKDIVIHVGDVTLVRKPNKNNRVSNLIRNLPGKKILIAGNHDTKEMISFYKECGWNIFQKIETEHVLIIHDPNYFNADKYKYVIHGHKHGNPVDGKNCFDVGVDALAQYSLIKLEDITDFDNAIEKEIIDKIIESICHQIVPDTFITCGECDYYCSEYCKWLKRKH